MINVLMFLKQKKYYAIGITIVLLFFLLRLVLLQNPVVELTYSVKQEDLVDAVQVSGTYTTASQTPVTSPASGIVDMVFVHDTDQVKKGDPLFHVQSSATVDQQKAAYAAYLVALTAVDTDTAKLNTLQSLMFQANQKFVNDRGVVNPSSQQQADPVYIEENADWLAAEANYKNQQGIIAKDRAALSSASQSYAETQSVTVIAPLGGTIVNLLTHPGDQVSADIAALNVVGTSTGQAMISSSIPEPILVIANLSSPYLTTDVSEDYATRVAIGQKASIIFDALKQETFSGIVENIDTVGTNTQGVVTYKTRIAIDNPSLVIKPNMTAIISIETLRKNNIIDVPNSAIVIQHSASFVESAKTHKFISVMLGIRGIAKTEIIRGLSVGTIILASPNQN